MLTSFSKYLIAHSVLKILTPLSISYTILLLSLLYNSSSSLMPQTSVTQVLGLPFLSVPSVQSPHTVFTCLPLHLTLKFKVFETQLGIFSILALFLLILKDCHCQCFTLIQTSCCPLSLYTSSLSCKSIPNAKYSFLEFLKSTTSFSFLFQATFKPICFKSGHNYSHPNWCGYRLFSPS